jgi:hypothetical protein
MVSDLLKAMAEAGVLLKTSKLKKRTKKLPNTFPKVVLV